MYEKTRHNVGFWFIDALAHHHHISLRKPWFKNWESGSCMLHSGHRLTLVKPLTFMNNSGAVLAENEALCPGPERLLLVCCDQMDLPAGSLRLKRRGGTAGHNGLKSVYAVIGADFSPLYIGIGRPDSGTTVIDYVLGAPSDQDAQVIEAALARALGAVEILLEQGIDPALAELNKKSDAASPVDSRSQD